MVPAEQDQATGSYCSRWAVMGALSASLHVALIAILVGTSEPSHPGLIESEAGSVADAEPLAPGAAAGEGSKGEYQAENAAAEAVAHEVSPRQHSSQELAKAEAVKTGFYSVKQGDTLIKLAKEYGLTPEKLAKLNGKETKRFARLWVGQRIKVPVRNGE